MMEPGDYALTLKEKEEAINEIRNAFANLEEAMIMINDAFSTLDIYEEKYCLDMIEQAHDLILKYLNKIEEREEYDGNDN